jgi:hypothetical protein
MEALLKWTEDTGKSVEWMYTPRNQLTEMTSILRPNVVISQATLYNYDWFETLLLSQRLLVAGQTKESCRQLEYERLIDGVAPNGREQDPSDCGYNVSHWRFWNRGRKCFSKKRALSSWLHETSFFVMWQRIMTGESYLGKTHVTW